MARRARCWVVLLIAGLLAAPVQADDAAAAAQSPTAQSSSVAKAPSDKDQEKADAKAKDEALRKKSDEYYELFQLFVDTMDQVERNYVKEVDRRELMEAAIQGVINKLDPYSNYIKPDDLDGFKTSIENKFGGLGIQVASEGGVIKVVSPMYNTPAYRAGIHAGDAIIEIEGESIRGVSLSECVDRLKGEPGTKVNITIQRPDGKKEKVDLTREIIRVETVIGGSRNDDDSWNYMVDPEHHIGYICINAFSRETADDVRSAMEELKKQDLKGLIIDLRFNPGGLLRSAIDICDMFISEGKIVSTKGRNTREQVWNASKEDTYEGFPMVVLVNRYSASASEIVSACLQDHKRAKIIGERTWGKGSVQNIIELESGKSALKLTTAGYFRPSGHNIHREPDSKESDEWGVSPDEGFALKLSNEEMSALSKHRRDRTIIVHHLEAKSQDKPADASPEDRKTDEPKSQDKKPDDNKPEDKKPEDKKSDEKKPKDKQDDSSSQKPEDKNSEAKPEEEPTDKADDKSDKSDDKPTASGDKKEPEEKKFVDRQLQMALDYLHKELRAENKTAAKTE